MDGGGAMEVSLVGHSALSAETMGWSFGEVVVGSRRAREWILEMEGRATRVLRMWEPWRVD